MYSRNPNPEEMTLVGRGDLPNLEFTVRFQQVIETLPLGASVPISIVKLGFLTGQLQVKHNDYEVEFSTEDIESQPQTQVPPQTLAATRWLLADLVGELSDKRKRVIGKYCDATGLNQPPEQGVSPDTVRKVAEDSYAGKPSFIQRRTEQSVGGSDRGGATNDDRSQRSGETSNRSRSSSKSSGDSLEEAPSRETAEDNPFAAGKEITTKGGERITGKNPFADPDRLKDTGLHQGGG